MLSAAALLFASLASLAAPATRAHHGIELAAFESCAVEAASADDLALLLPSDSVAFARASSLRRALTNVAHLTGEAPTDDAALLEFASSGLGVESAPWLEHLDLDRPCAAAVAFRPGGSPEFTLLLPVRDAQALVAKVGASLDGLEVRSAGDYIVLETSQPAAALGGLDVSAFSALAQHDFALHIDLGQVRKAVGPLVDMVFDQAETEIDSTEEYPEAANAMLDGLSDTRLMWNSAQSLVAFLDERNGQLDFGGDIALSGAEWVAKRFGEQRYDLRGIARLADPDAALTMLWSGAPKLDGGHGAAWLDVLQSELGERAKPLARIQARAFELAVTKAGPLTAMNLALGVDGLFGALYLSTPEPAALTEQLADLFAAPEWGALGFEFSGPHERTVQGVGWREYVSAIDVGRIVEALAPQAQFGADEQLAAQRSVEALFGRQGLRVALTAAEGFAVAQLGGAERDAAATAARLTRPAPALPPQFVEALERASDANSSFVAHFDVGLLLQQASEFAAGIGEPIDLPAAMLGQRLPITVHGAISPRSARGGISIDVHDLARFVNAMKDER